MTKTKQKDNTTAAVTFGSVDFFHYLQERPLQRFSRFEAYIYMLDKACMGYRPQNIEEKWIPAIGDGQFFTTKTELATDWHWHRATVRDFLGKLEEFGCLVMEEHLKGTLCTMPRLITTFNTSVAVCYNFDAMAKYTMYSWADGRLRPHQVERIIGQMERSARVMLAGTVVSPYAEKQLEDITRMVIHYAIEAIIAHHPGELVAAKEIGLSPSLVEKRTLEFFTGHLGGSWRALLSLLYKRTEVALDALVESMKHGMDERIDIFQRLYNVAASIKGVPLDPLPSADVPDGLTNGLASENSASVASNKPSESDAEPMSVSAPPLTEQPSK